MAVLPCMLDLTADELLLAITALVAAAETAGIADAAAVMAEFSALPDEPPSRRPLWDEFVSRPGMRQALQCLHRLYIECRIGDTVRTVQTSTGCRAGDGSHISRYDREAEHMTPSPDEKGVR